jgi:hypothetical protein
VIRALAVQNRQSNAFEAGTVFCADAYGTERTPMSALALGLNSNIDLKRRKSRGRYAVLLITCPDGWRPNSRKGLPPTIVSAQFLKRNLKCAEACAVAQGINLAALREYTGTWAVVVSSMFGVVAEPVAPCRCAEMAVAHE